MAPGPRGKAAQVLHLGGFLLRLLGCGLRPGVVVRIIGRETDLDRFERLVCLLHGLDDQSLDDAQSTPAVEGPVTQLVAQPHVARRQFHEEPFTRHAPIVRRGCDRLREGHLVPEQPSHGGARITAGE
ncbi:MAG: hypothetical protein J2P58_11375 [Acidimicrobiaceae bacterium]|nr:hypothetical protein [Acidimicrobiaceae bacterium]